MADQIWLNILKAYFCKNNKYINNFLEIMLNANIITEYCCDVLAGGPNCYLDMLDKIQK